MIGREMKISRDDMKKYGHTDDWGVDCLYLEEAQSLFDEKTKELKAGRDLLRDGVKERICLMDVRD
jgi:hypothetical protein